MTKSELVKIISKKAAVTDSSAKELFDLFLQKIADDLQPGESAQFSNVGYFHFRNGKVKKDKQDAEGEITEYLDLIIFSPSVQLNIKSPENLVFSVPDIKNVGYDNLDDHFSLSAGKPVHPKLEGKDPDDPAIYSTDEIDGMLKRKVESLMVNLKKAESTISESEIMLVDVRTIDEDQLELELDEESKEKNSEKISDTSIHSSEKLKSIAWGFGKDLSRQIQEESIPDVEKEKYALNDDSERTGWDFGKSYWDDSSDLIENEKIEIDEIERKDNRDKEVEDKIKINLPKESLHDEKNVDDLEIEMDDFKVSDQEEKIGKFERVRSISSSLSEESSMEVVKGFERFLDDKLAILDETIDYDEEFKKITSKAEQFQSTGKKDSSEEPKKPVDVQKPKKEFKFNRTNAIKRHRNITRKSSTSKVFSIVAIMIVLAGVIYLMMKDGNEAEVVEDVMPPIERSENTTYIERTYDIPVTYPYDKSETENQIVGIGTGGPTEIKPGQTSKQTKPPVEKEQKIDDQKVIFSGQKPLGTPTQAAYNIYQYGSIFVVQVSAFRSKNMAEKEASKYITRDLNAFIEEAAINGTVWYRVRVGNFNTLDKAKQFRKSK
jgi:nucleoid DNA-binding protein